MLHWYRQEGGSPPSGRKDQMERIPPPRLKDQVERRPQEGLVSWRPSDQWIMG